MQRLTRYLLPIFVAVLFFNSLTGIAEAKKKVRRNKADIQLPDPNNFPTSTVINNPYLPMVPGTTFVYQPADDNTVVNTVEVTQETKVIIGITCVVVHDYETVNGVLDEDTFDWYAQDKDGNVWYFGEDTTAYLPGGGISHEGSWEAGVNGAEPGIIMMAKPVLGMAYQQEYSAGVAEDMAKVLRLNAKVSVPYGDFVGCLETKEWSPLEKGVIEHKFYAPGIGLVLTEELKGKTIREELVSKTP